MSIFSARLQKVLLGSRCDISIVGHRLKKFLLGLERGMLILDMCFMGDFLGVLVGFLFHSFDAREFLTSGGQWSDELWESLYFRHYPLGIERPETSYLSLPLPLADREVRGCYGCKVVRDRVATGCINSMTLNEEI